MVIVITSPNPSLPGNINEPPTSIRIQSDSTEPSGKTMFRQLQSKNATKTTWPKTEPNKKSRFL